MRTADAWKTMVLRMAEFQEKKVDGNSCKIECFLMVCTAYIAAYAYSFGTVLRELCSEWSFSLAVADVASLKLYRLDSCIAPPNDKSISITVKVGSWWKHLFYRHSCGHNMPPCHRFRTILFLPFRFRWCVAVVTVIVFLPKLLMLYGCWYE